MHYNDKPTHTCDHQILNDALASLAVALNDTRAQARALYELMGQSRPLFIWITHCVPLFNLCIEEASSILLFSLCGHLQLKEQIKFLA